MSNQALMFSLPKEKKKINYIVASLKRSVNFQTSVSILLTIDFRIVHLGNVITLHLNLLENISWKS